MLSTSKAPAELQSQRSKLASSYTELYEEFSSKELRSVGNYQLGHLIGKGSFGKVYLATHKLTNGSKVVLKSANKDDSNLAREIHHHRQFLHPHIARLYEVIVTEKLVWLVLEYCPGDELYHYLTQTGPVEPSVVQKIFTQLVGAVSYVHAKSCVHRDLKLENILLDKNQSVKLVDFGFTREYEGKASYLQTWCGTVCYSAPEMLKGEKYAGEKVDVWSLGVILYALLCGELPFDEDDENQTKIRILKEEPKYPESMPTAARELVNLLLSKRPLLRPSLADILTNPWLAEHSPQQQAILKLQQPPPFSTQLEKDTLQRLRSAGVDIDIVIENVLSQRCDSLAGWWALLLEKEERKAKRRERKRKEREGEAKANRRISAASGRLIAPTIKESDEEGMVLGDRRRDSTRANGSASVALEQVPESHPVKDLPRTPSTNRLPHRVTSNARRRSQLGPPRDYAKRSSQLSVLAASPELLKPDAKPKKGKRRNPPFMSQIASIKHWFKESAKRAKSPTSRYNSAGLLHPNAAQERSELHRISSDVTPPRPSISQNRPDLASRAAYQTRPRLNTNHSTGSVRRLSHSPSPLTPSSNRRSTGSNLRGRQSTSSSVSSIRSVHAHHPSQSIASSNSSSSVVSPSLSAKNNYSNTSRRASPNLSSLKVLPKTPPTSIFPNDVRFTRSPPPPALNLAGESRAAFSGLPHPSSPGLMFAKRKRTPFRGPMLGPGTSSGRRRSVGSVGSNGAGGSRSGSVQGRNSGEVIAEEDEDEYEEVEAFSPVEPENEGFMEYSSAEGPSGEDGGTSLGLAPASTSFDVTMRPRPGPTDVSGEAGGAMVEEETLKALERRPSAPT